MEDIQLPRDNKIYINQSLRPLFCGSKILQKYFVVQKQNIGKNM